MLSGLGSAPAGLLTGPDPSYEREAAEGACRAITMVPAAAKAKCVVACLQGGCLSTLRRLSSLQAHEREVYLAGCYSIMHPQDLQVLVQ